MTLTTYNSLGDPLYVVYQEIRKLLGSESVNKRVKAKTVFGLLQK